MQFASALNESLSNKLDSIDWQSFKVAKNSKVKKFLTIGAIFFFLNYCSIHLIQSIGKASKLPSSSKRRQVSHVKNFLERCMIPQIETEEEIENIAGVENVRTKLSDSRFEIEEPKNETQSKFEVLVQFKSLFFVYIAVFTDVLGFGIVFPLLPIFAKDKLGANSIEIGAISACYSTFSFLGATIWGSLSDHLKKRKIFLLGGLFGVGLGQLIFGFADQLYLLFIARAIAGLLNWKKLSGIFQTCLFALLNHSHPIALK